MIFPDVRISELEREAAERGRRFAQSRENFLETVRQQTKPFVLFKNNLKPILFTLFTAVSGWKLLVKAGTKLVSKNKGTLIWKLLKARFTWKLLKMGFRALLKKKSQRIEDLGWSLIKNLTSRKW